MAEPASPPRVKPRLRGVSHLVAFVAALWLLRAMQDAFGLDLGRFGVRPREWRRALPEKVAIAPASPEATSCTTSSSETLVSESRKAPPDTGGISATMSPSASTVSLGAYSRLTA